MSRAKYSRTTGKSEQQDALDRWEAAEKKRLAKEYRSEIGIVFGIEKRAFLAGFRAAQQRLGLKSK